MKDTIAIILAAGEGTRMKSALPKVLHPICGKPMVDCVIDAVRAMQMKDIFVVVSRRFPKVVEHLKESKVTLVYQQKPLGTADAIRSVLPFLNKKQNADVVIVCADTPLIRQETLEALIRQHQQMQSSCTMLTAHLENPYGFGRIVRNSFNKVIGIVEENDATPAQKQIKEFNTGIYCFKVRDLIEALSKVKVNPKKGEYYLTEVIGILYGSRKVIETFVFPDAEEVVGINSRVELARVNATMRLRIMKNLMDDGVSVVDPQTTYVNHGVSIGKDTTIYPFTFIEAGVKIGSNCSIGPFCRLRKGSVVADDVCVGNFTEINRSSLGEGVRCKHVSYLGDANVGKHANIGAGTIIANYDGKQKNPTTIGDHAFIGCDSVIIAPAKIGKYAITGAGSVVTRGTHVKDKTVVVGIPARPLVRKAKTKK